MSIAIETTLDELGYRSYMHNRNYGITPEKYALCVPGCDVDAYETRYLAELADGGLAAQCYADDRAYYARIIEEAE